MNTAKENISLIELASEARNKAYVPYSRFRVGAALIDDNGEVFTGCNVENASYGATCCAERTAIFKAVSEGSSKIRKLAVVCDQDDYCRPCGICRQVMAEFAADEFLLISAKPNGEYEELSLDQILPLGFRLKKNQV